MSDYCRFLEIVIQQAVPSFMTGSHTRVGILIVTTIYLQLIKNRYMFRSLLSFNVVTSIVYNPLPAMWKS